ncbi:MAG: homocysteine S-methyltransferase family protein [Chloroflexi bacterium]|nr:homocysteine S-methyltransferase family protein [Chloroflexota bacterium]
MPTRSVMDRLRAGDVLLMDGGTGSEIQRRGADVLVDTTAETELRAWSATANIEFADVVQQVHQDYLRVGADIIISNNFWTTPSRLELIGRGQNWEEYARAAGENALRAREVLNPEAYVFGGISAPYRQDYRVTSPKPDVEVLGKEAFDQEFLGPAGVLSGLGVDALLPEYVGFIDDCVAAVDACATLGLPVFLGVRHITDYGWMQYGETLQDLVKALEGHQVDGILLMCSRPECVSVALPALRQAFDGPIGAYANVGYNPMAPVRGRTHKGDDLAVGYSPSRLAEFAQDWKEMGAQIIGGCCATGPEHIMALRRVVKG